MKLTCSNPSEDDYFSRTDNPKFYFSNDTILKISCSLKNDMPQSLSIYSNIRFVVSEKWGSSASHLG